MVFYYNKIVDFAFQPHPYSITLTPGHYRFEAWGASGENLQPCGGQTELYPANGRGAYTSGIISLKKTQTFYVYVGQKGQYSSTFNANNETGNVYPGGGATDIRLAGGNWFNFDSLKTRIIVAAGSGSSERYCGGDGGTFEGHSNEILYNATYFTTGGTQVSGGNFGYYPNHGHGEQGKFGIGGHGKCIGDIPGNCDGGPGGGGGYYGGGGTTRVGSGGGGSSFVSGMKGCDAIKEISTEHNITHSHQPIHYSGLYFFNGRMISGRDLMPAPDGSVIKGNKDNGYARISLLSFPQCTQTTQIRHQILIYLVIII